MRGWRFQANPLHTHTHTHTISCSLFLLMGLCYYCRIQSWFGKAVGSVGEAPSEGTPPARLCGSPLQPRGGLEWLVGGCWRQLDPPGQMRPAGKAAGCRCCVVGGSGAGEAWVPSPMTMKRKPLGLAFCGSGKRQALFRESSEDLGWGVTSHAFREPETAFPVDPTVEGRGMRKQPASRAFSPRSAISWLCGLGIFT